MSVKSYNFNKRRDDFGLTLIGALIVISLAISVYTLREKLVSTSLLFASLAVFCFIRVYIWRKFERLEWVKIDSFGLEYRRGNQNYKVSLSDSVEIKHVTREGVGWGTQVDLVTKHGNLRLNDNIGQVDELVKEIRNLWQLKGFS